MQLNYFSNGGVGYTGAVKLQVPAMTGGCCDCSSGDSSLIVIYDNGAPIDLWQCQGCRCNQLPIQDIAVVAGTKALLLAGATLPEEVCGQCCYGVALAGDPGLFEAYSNGINLRASGLEDVALAIQLQMATQKISQLEKAKVKAVENPVEKPVECIPDPFAVYLASITCS